MNHLLNNIIGYPNSLCWMELSPDG